MAVAPRDIKNFKDNLICAICLDSVKDPRKLTCDHSFCLACLAQHIADTRVGFVRSFQCPSCRTNIGIKSWRLTAEEIAKSFPQNAFLVDMDKKVRAYESGFISCETHPGVPGQYVCITDLIFLCSSCAVITHRSSTCKLVDVADARKFLGGKIKAMEELCDRRINEVTNLLSDDEQKRRLNLIKRNTLKEIDDFMARIYQTFEKIYEDADLIRKSVETITLPPSYKNNISKHVAHFMEQKSKLKNLRLTSERLGETVNEMIKIKRNISRKVGQLDCGPESAFVKNSKTEAITNEDIFKNLVGDLSHNTDRFKKMGPDEKQPLNDTCTNVIRIYPAATRR